MVLAGEGRRDDERLDDGRERPGSLVVYETLQRARGQLLESRVRQSQMN